MSWGSAAEPQLPKSAAAGKRKHNTDMLKACTRHTLTEADMGLQQVSRSSHLSISRPTQRQR
eukprot:scaffold242263_cov18-Tisochrysis_lutea.AAC.2